MAKKYSLNVENDEVVSVEVDGVHYDHPDQIPDPKDREKIRLLMSRPPSESFDHAFDKEFDKQFEEDFRELERESARFPKVIVDIFLAVSLLMLGIASVSALSTYRTLSREASAPGQVVDLAVRKNQSGQEYYYPVVEFSLPDESRQTVQLAEGSRPAPHEKGEAVIVLYDPQRPLNARIASRSTTLNRWILPGITGVLGVAFLIASLFAVRITRSSPGEAQEKSSSRETMPRG